MNKIVGTALLMLVSLLLADEKRKAMKREPDDLKSLSDSLVLFRFSLLQYGKTLPAIFEELGEKPDDRVSGFFRELSANMPLLADLPFSELWSQNVRKEEWGFSRETILTMDVLGCVLGQYDASYQAEVIEKVEKEIRFSQQKMAESCRKKTPCILTLGLAGGFVLSVLMW